MVTPSCLILAFTAMLSESGDALRHRSEREASARATFDDFVAQFDGETSTRYDEEKAAVREIYGARFDVGLLAGQESNLEWMCRSLVDAYSPMFGFSADSLTLRKVKPLALSALGTSNKTAVIFEQSVGGLPVQGASLTFLFNEAGALLSVSNHCLPMVEEIEILPSMNDEQAIDTARAVFPGRAARVRSVDCCLVWSEAKRAPVTAWVIELRSPGPDGVPVQEKITVDAQDGSILDQRSTIHFFSDTTGRVLGRGTPGLEPDVATNPPVLVPMEGVHVELFFGFFPFAEALTDEQGMFTIPSTGVSLEATVDFDVSSPLVRVIPASGDPVASTRTVNPGVVEEWNLNGAGLRRKTSQINVHQAATKFVKWIHSIDPTDDTMDFQQLARVNRTASTCMAFFDGTATNYDDAGGGCVNLAYSSVIAHEIGHWANVRYGSGNGPDGFGEGNADVFANYLYDDPVIGRSFCGPTCNPRTATTNRQYCGSCAAGCYSIIHWNGEPHMASFWNMRERLNENYGNTLGDRKADTLFLAWMNAYDDSQVCDIVRDHLLVLDDDDGQLWNGTPHGLEIDNAFSEQGYPSRYNGSFPRDRGIGKSWR